MGAVDHVQVWLGLLNADRLSRYYGRLADHYSRWDRIFTSTTTVASLVIAGAGLGIAVGSLPGRPVPIPIVTAAWVLLGASLVVAVAGLWASHAGCARKAAAAANIATLNSELAAEWKQLWFSLYTEDASFSLRSLSRRAATITHSAPHVGLAENKKLNEQCEDEANGYWQAALTH